nr:hypothetical protein [Tanacetum cinerariifolium]
MAIIDRQLPFEYTITITDVMVIALPVQNIHHSTFRSMFEREKLFGNNFDDWFLQLKLVLRVEKKMHVIEQPIPPAAAANSAANVVTEWNTIYDACKEVACLMLGSMTPELHRQFENYSPYEMIWELKSMFEKQAGVERFDLIQTFLACKQEDGKPVASYVLKMKEYVDQLERLGYVLTQDLSVGLIFNGLTRDFAGFVRIYNMHNMEKTIGEVHAMLIEYEKVLPKKAETPQVMVIRTGKIQKANKKSLKAKGKVKANGNGKDKQVYIPKPKNPKPIAKEHPAKDNTYHHCKEVGHWKKNCPVYLAELLKKKKQVGTASSSGIFTIELFSFLNKSWVYDTGYGTHICITKQRLRGARKLEQRALYLYVGNGCFTNYRILVSKNDVLYFNAIPRDGIYEIDIHNLVPNVNSIYNVSNKRAKHNLDSTYLWHCRLTHISKKRIEKLQHEWLLKSTDDESFDQCVSCLSGKMARKPFLYRTERETDSLGIIHTDIEVVNTYAKSLKIILKLVELSQQLTPPYTPQHNGVSERRNRTLLDMFQSMMNLTTLPLSFWDYALESATRILNMVPTKKVNKTPYELWHRKVLNLSYLKVWGCEVLVKRDMPDKLHQRSVKCIFIGYPKETMGYYFYFPPKNKNFVARYAEFFEKSLITQEVSGRAIDLEEIQDEDTSPSEITSEISIEVEGF